MPETSRPVTTYDPAAVQGHLHSAAAVVHYGDPAAEYAALTRGKAIVALDGWTQVELTGQDRVQLLSNLSTNDIKSLQPGQSRESLLLNVKGHILAQVCVSAGPDKLRLLTVPGQAERVINQLDRYIIREDVQLADQTGLRTALLVAGVTAEELAPKLAERALAAGDCDILSPPELPAGSPPAVYWLGNTSLLLTVAQDAAAVAWQTLVELGCRPCGMQPLDQARVEARMPWYGVDATDENLPQELARDAAAISFTKGCYLGQETVARIDALGHVNKTLAVVRFSGDELPTAGTTFSADGKEIGRVTSAVRSPQFAAPLAMAYLRRGHQVPGTELSSSSGPAVVVDVP